MVTSMLTVYGLQCQMLNSDQPHPTADIDLWQPLLVQFLNDGWCDYPPSAHILEYIPGMQRLLPQACGGLFSSD